MDPMTTAEVIRAGELELRPADHIALADGRTMPLSTRELELLAALVSREGRVVPREELFHLVWRAPMRATDRSVDVYVHKLRTKLGSALPHLAFIHTHFGFGYRFSPEPSHPFHKAATSR